MPKSIKKRQSNQRIISFAFDDSDDGLNIENLDYYFLFDYEKLGHEGLIIIIKKIIDFNDTRMEIYEGFCEYFQEIIDKSIYLKLVHKHKFHQHFLICCDDE